MTTGTATGTVTGTRIGTWTDKIVRTESKEEKSIYLSFFV